MMPSSTRRSFRDMWRDSIRGGMLRCALDPRGGPVPEDVELRGDCDPTPEGGQCRYRRRNARANHSRTGRERGTAFIGTAKCAGNVAYSPDQIKRYRMNRIMLAPSSDAGSRNQAYVIESRTAFPP